jgi:hypothetical protein
VQGIKMRAGESQRLEQLRRVVAQRRNHTGVLSGAAYQFSNSLHCHSNTLLFAATALPRGTVNENVYL